jgi:tight adherence protein C
VNGVEITSMCALLSGAVLVLAELPWFRDRALVDRLRPYSPGATPARRATYGIAGLQQVVGPIAQGIGSLISRLLGVSTDLALRLERAGRRTEPDSFRLRQLAHGVISLVVVGALCLALRPDPVVVLAGLCGAPVLTVLLHEQSLSRAADLRRRQLSAELPVLVEQLGLLVSAGYSVTGALARLATRSNGVATQDLQRVLLRIRHGEPELAALAEWADRSDLHAVGRVNSVLALHGETADLGLLISDEARSIRAESHRDLLETIERRAQLVWVPVTLATLVPGLIFLAVPFTSAMQQVTGGP